MKKFEALLFDINGTLIDILTDEGSENVWRTTSAFLGYHGVMIAPPRLRELYSELNHRQRSESPEKFPEFDVVLIFAEIVRRFRIRRRAAELAREAALVFRSASLLRLELYPGVGDLLPRMGESYLLGAVSDGQPLWAVPEMRMAGLERFLSFAVISGDLGFRKPDGRMFETALKRLKLPPEDVLFVGNDMYRDVFGARQAGMKTVFFKSNQGSCEYAGAEPDYIIRDFRELPRAVTFLEEHR